MLSAIQKRRSHRAYLDKPVEDEKLKEVMQAAMCAPSGHNKNPWEFVIVKEDETKESLSRATNYATFSKQAPVIIVLTAREGCTTMWIEDTSIVAAHIYLEATNQRLGTCWIQIHDMETPDGKDSEEYVRSLLGIPDTHKVLCMMPLGYSSDKLPEHDENRYDAEKIHDEKW